LARIARLVVPGYPHHVTQRGARKLKTFFSDSDYKMYIDLLAKGCKKAGVEVWAYCLMPNHAHLVAVPERRDSLACLFRQAHRAYTLAINVREGWQGHLWQERFHSFVMDENYLLATVRYVELNPVRAGLCSKPEDWTWSSYAAHYCGKNDKLVAVEPMLRRIHQWREFVRSDDQDAERFEILRSRSRTGRPAGSEAFIDKLERATGRCLRRRKPGPKKIS